MGELGAVINTTSFDFDEECLSLAEESAQEVINCLHPTLDSEERRWDVIDYIQRLIKSNISSCEVFPYGSVPLKTYLPDGDIDLTTIKSPKGESLAHEVFALLQAEEQNINAEFQVQDTKFIDAEVKLVKCIVRNIVIDLSFNQLGGLSTLCFLERVDRIVGRNHLFKRSIILVKIWCYYESRILGSHHGLISTYALETLVLYIFQFFHSSLSGPLAVLYKFLDYYSQFDWENYCISLQGPVCKSSLPDIVVKMPESGSNDLMLGQAFLKNCIDLFTVQSRELETNSRAFQTKHLNIIDPLKENNNLGRSVHKGNFYRIRSAFKYGVRKLRQVFFQRKDRVAKEISIFFANTLARDGQQQKHRSSIRHLALELEESLAVSEPSTLDMFSDDDMLLQSSISDYDDESVGFEDKHTTDLKNEIDRYSARETSSDYTSSSICSASMENHSHKLQFSSESSVENGSLESHQFELLNCAAQKFSFNSWLENRNKYVETNKECQWCLDDNSKAGCTCSNSWTPKANVLDSQNFGEMDSMSIGGESEALDPLADLSGDYESHVRSLLYGQLCHISAFCTPAVNNPSPAPSRVQNQKPWDVVHQSMPIRQTAVSSKMNLVTMPMEAFRQTAAFSQVDSNATPMEPIWQSASFSQMNLSTTLLEQTVNPPATDPTFCATAFCFDGKERARGTGMYFPNTGLQSALYMEKSAYGRGRKRTPGNRNPLHRSGSFPTSRGESDNAALWVPPAQSKSQGQWRSDHSPRGSNGYLSRSCRIEFGSLGNLGEEVTSCSTHVTSSTPRAPLKTQQCSKAIMKQEKVGAGHSIRLKNEDEFPPLCL